MKQYLRERIFFNMYKEIERSYLVFGWANSLAVPVSKAIGLRCAFCSIDDDVFLPLEIISFKVDSFDEVKFLSFASSPEPKSERNKKTETQIINRDFTTVDGIVDMFSSA